MVRSPKLRLLAVIVVALVGTIVISAIAPLIGGKPLPDIGAELLDSSLVPLAMGVIAALTAYVVLTVRQKRRKRDEPDDS